MPSCEFAGHFPRPHLSVGYGFGSHAVVAVEGSQASAIHLLDYFYLQATTDPAARPGLTTLSYALDEHGVTPITIQSRVSGLRITSDPASQCRLEISLRAVPPREDITLVFSRVPTRGTFSGLPEGSEITASYQGKTYRWALTYRGGAGGHDLVLLSRNTWEEGAPVTHVHPIPQPPAPLLAGPSRLPAGHRPRHSRVPRRGRLRRFLPRGAGGREIYVDNLNDSGPGSLRAAVEAEGPRIVVFRVGGSIALQTRLNIRHPFLTLDAQSSPGEGITLRNHGIAVRTHDVVLRYFRIRLGDEGVDQSVRYEAGEGEDAAPFPSRRQDCIADHLSLSWTTGKVITITLTPDRITIQWCILSESLNFAGHGYASLAAANASPGTTICSPTTTAGTSASRAR